MTIETENGRQLDALLAELHEMLPDSSTQDVAAFADAHPGYRRQILAFAAAWLVMPSGVEGEGVSDEQPSSGVVAALDRFWAKGATPVSDPFAALDYAALERIAAECRIDASILRKLERRLIDAMTIPGKLLAWLAHSLGSDIASLFGFLCGAPVSSGADYYAPSGPKATGKINFADAVRSSTLTGEQKDFWLREAGS
ncbi:hypothetical protein GCM10007937_47770 [Mesorhizobium albiziae]|nr:hypothetical protein [Mesorhizobium albiziae]GLS33066.1 hypothetical protein GCM10007937_47770 [Mesorhizobium albiziae]